MRILQVFARGASTKILLKGGGRYDWHVDNPKGEPEVPATNEEVRNRFKTLVIPILSEDKVNHIIKTIDELEKLQEIKDLIIYLS